MKKSLFTLACVLAAATIGAAANGQATTTYEDGPDGVKYRVTRQVVQRSIPTTEYQTREQKVYRPQVTTEYQSYQQTYLTSGDTVPIGSAFAKLVEPVWQRVLDARLAAGDSLGSAAGDGASSRRAHQLGRGNAHDASAGDDLSHGAGRIHADASGERRADRFEPGSRRRNRDQRRQPADPLAASNCKAIRRERQARGRRLRAATLSTVMPPAVAASRQRDQRR